MKRTYIKDLGQNVGQEVSISGFVHTLRVQSKIIFLILMVNIYTLMMNGTKQKELTHK